MNTNAVSRRMISPAAYAAGGRRAFSMGAAAIEFGMPVMPY
jgi:hypothetical protein